MSKNRNQQRNNNFMSQEQDKVQSDTHATDSDVTNEETTQTQEVSEQEVPQQVVEDKVEEVTETKPVVIDPVPVTTKEVKRIMNKVESELNNYKEAMDPAKAIDPQEGGRWQHTLLMQIKGILNNPDQATFVTEWNALLAFFHREKAGFFNEGFMFRFPQHWIGSAAEFALFRRLVYLIIQTADPQTRIKNARDINLSSATETLNENVRNRLFDFYA